MNKRILITGATSFTGAHIARALGDAGFQVVATLTRRLVHYSDPLIQKRREYSQISEWIEEAPFGSARMIEAIRSIQPHIFVNHGADIKGYRQPDFDYLGSVAASLTGLRPVVEALASSGCQRWIHTGSIFEPDEGEAGLQPTPSAEAMSIYGVSKSMVWQPVRFFAVKSGLKVSKIIIPNPVGPFENPDRMIPFFVKTWKSGGVPTLKTPQLIRDNIPASWLARTYVDEAQWGDSGRDSVRIRRPSGYALSNEAFLQLFVKNFEHLMDHGLPFEIAPQIVDEPLKRINTEPCPELMNEADRHRFWEEWATSVGRW